MKRIRSVNILAVVGVVTLCAVVVGGIYLVFVIRSGFSSRDEPSWIEARIARAARRLAIPGQSRRLANPVAVTPEVLAGARTHWADHCALCHANNGSGDTPLGRNLYPQAPDMRATSTQELTDGELYYVIQNGIRLTAMPAWGEPVDDDKDSWALVAFIRHLPHLSAAEIEEMKGMNPVSPHELREEEQDAEFLRGEQNPQQHQHSH